MVLVTFWIVGGFWDFGLVGFVVCWLVVWLVGWMDIFLCTFIFYMFFFCGDIFGSVSFSDIQKTSIYVSYDNNRQYKLLFCFWSRHTNRVERRRKKK